MFEGLPKRRGHVCTVMASLSRKRTLVDLGSLGPPLKAHARSRGLTVSESVRQAVASVIETSASLQEPVPEHEGTAGKAVKMTVRLRPGVAARISATARSCGLSHGAYLSTLFHETPPPPLAVVTALGASTERLAAVSTDLSELLRILKRDGAASASLVDDGVRPLLADVRRHVEVAARLVAELRPGRTRSAGP